jgi:hypothetical protein
MNRFLIFGFSAVVCFGQIQRLAVLGAGMDGDVSYCEALRIDGDTMARLPI